MSRYRLTFLSTKERTEDKWSTEVAPTNEWIRYDGPRKIGALSCTRSVHLRAVA